MPKESRSPRCLMDAVKRPVPSKILLQKGEALTFQRAWLTTFREKIRMHWKLQLVMGVKNDSEGCALSGTLVRRTRGHHVCIAHHGWHHCILTEGCKASKCVFHLIFPKLSPPSHGGHLAHARFSWTWIFLCPCPFLSSGPDHRLRAASQLLRTCACWKDWLLAEACLVAMPGAKGGNCSAAQSWKAPT